jgi:hypothetical protein
MASTQKAFELYSSTFMPSTLKFTSNFPVGEMSNRNLPEHTNAKWDVTRKRASVLHLFQARTS